MILIDNTQLLIATILTQTGGNTSVIDESMVRHIALNTYRMYRTKFKHKYGELVLCQDAGDVWRKSVFPNYKSNRKKAEGEDQDRWRRIFAALSSIREEVRQNFPYKNMRVSRCEADDVIAVLCKRFHGREPIVIVSSDKDFMQLQQYSGVDQYSPTTKGFLKCADPQQTLVEHIIRGDSGDGVPNVLSDDDCFITDGKRQRPVTQKKLKELQAVLGDSNLFFDEALSRNWRRNKTLIDLSQIPEDVEQAILNTWEEPHDSSRSRLLDYFMQYKLKNLTECIDEF